MSTWHYMKNGVQTGPVTTEELRSLIASGAVPSNSLVWRNGLAGWEAANQQPEFAGSVPPPSAPAALATSTAASTGAAPGEFVPDPADVEKNKVFAIISYISILWLVPLLAARESKFAMYHCNQGLVLTLTWLTVWIAKVVLFMVLWHIPGGYVLISLLSLAVWCGLLALVIVGIVNAANGRCKPLPLIGNRFVLIK